MLVCLTAKHLTEEAARALLGQHNWQPDKALFTLITQSHVQTPALARPAQAVTVDKSSRSIQTGKTTSFSTHASSKSWRQSPSSSSSSPSSSSSHIAASPSPHSVSSSSSSSSLAFQPPIANDTKVASQTITTPKAVSDAKSFNGSEQQLLIGLGTTQEEAPPFRLNANDVPRCDMNRCVEYMQATGLQDYNKRCALLDWLLQVIRNPDNLAE